MFFWGGVLFTDESQSSISASWSSHASPHFVLCLLLFLLERQRFGTLVREVLILISCDMTS